MIIRKLRGKQRLLAIALAAGVAVSAVAGSAVIKSGKTEAQAATTDTSTSQTPPALPDGSTPPTPPDGSTPQAPPNGSNGAPGQDGSQKPGNPPDGMNGGGVTEYTAANTYTSDQTIQGKTITSTGTDENAILVQNNAKVTISDSTIKRTSSDSTGGDNSSFYGVGATVLTTEGTTTVRDSTITTDAKGGAGVFSYGNGVSYVENTKITTKQDTSGGLHVAGGGKLYAWDVTATTNGESSAAIRSDRGGGTMVVDGGTYTSNGTGSPAIYSTADIAVKDATLTANGSEAICIEGLNSIRLFNSDLTGNIPTNSQNDCNWNVILYQSMSGDSQVGNSTFEMQGGSLTAKNGGMFYTTNTESTFIIKNVDITYANDNDFFLKCTGNSNQRGWGTAGANGADCSFTGIAQKMQGDVIWDSISKLDFYMTDGSTLTGAVTDDESNAGNGGNGYCNLYIDKTSKWVVTADSTLTNLYNAGTIVDASGNTVTIKGTDGTVYVKGTSSVTVTVGSYSASVDLSGASATTKWSDYSVSKTASSDTSSDSFSASDNSQVGKETVKNAKAVGKHKIKVTWKKDTAADGYQIAYRVKGGTWQYTTVTSEDTLSKTLTGLKSGKTYQIKVRAYENVNGEKVYGSYSTIKKVKCK